MDRALTTTLMVCIVATIPASAQPRGASQRDSAASARARIHKLEELTWPQIDALDRNRTMFILPVGMIEEHGPHLPVGADTLAMLFEAERASRRVSGALPEWTILLMPPLHYGQGGANQIAARLVHPGTYAIRQSTLRSMVADLGASVAQNGFRWIFGVRPRRRGVVGGGICRTDHAGGEGRESLQHPRVPDRLPPAMAPMLQQVLEAEQAFESKLDRWLAQRRDR